MSITVTTVEIDNTYKISGTFLDKNGNPVTASETKFRVYSSDYTSEVVSAMSMISGDTLGTYVAYFDTGALPVGKYIFRIEGIVSSYKVGDNAYVKIMNVEPE